MSDEERKVAETQGDFRYAIKQGSPVPDDSWKSCQITLTTERLVLATGSNRHAIPHSRIELWTRTFSTGRKRRRGQLPAPPGEGAVDEVRTRTGVTLDAQGRNTANQATTED